MLVISFLLSIVGLVLAEDDACKFKANTPMTQSELRKCYDTIPWDKNLTEEFFTNLDKYLQMSQFTEVLKHPPKGYEDIRIDQEAELMDIKKAVNNGTFTSEYQVHDHLQRLYKRAHDPHQVYYPPYCYRKFYYSLSYGPKLQMDENGYTEVLFRKVNDTTVSKMYNEFYDKYSTTETAPPDPKVLDGYEGRKITEINGKTPFEFYKSMFHFSGLSKSLGSVINALDRYELKHSDGYDGFLPFDKLTMKLAAEGDKEEVTVTVPYMYYYLFDINSNEEFKNYCINGVEPPAPQELKDLLAKADSDEKYLKFNHKKILEYIYKTRYAKNNENNTEAKVENDTSVADDADDNDKTCSTKIKEFAKDTKESMYYIYTVEEEDKSNIGIFVLSSFMYYDEDIVRSLYKDLNRLNEEKKIKRLIIDLRGNGGGYAYLVSVILTWLNGKQETYTQMMWRKRRNEMSDLMLDLEHPINEDYYTHHPIDYDETYNTREYMHFSGYNEKGEEEFYASEYTEMSTSETYSHMEDGKFITTAHDDYAHPIFNLDREHIHIIGDGTGGSGTGVFMWGAEQFMIARLISYGGYKDATNDIKAHFASFTGASVVDSDGVQEMIKETKKSNDKYPTPLPHGSIVRATWISIFPSDSPSQLQEFRPANGEYHIYGYTNDNLERIPDYATEWCSNTEFFNSIMEAVKSHSYGSGLQSDWPDAVSGDVSTCGTPDNTSFVYAHTWDDTKKDYVGDCKFAYCKDYHYFDYATRTCVAIPDINANEASGDSSYIVFLVFTIIFFIATIAFVVLWVLSIKGIFPKK